jgi:hypothetical protein
MDFLCLSILCFLWSHVSANKMWNMSNWGWSCQLQKLLNHMWLWSVQTKVLQDHGFIYLFTPPPHCCRIPCGLYVNTVFTLEHPVVYMNIVWSINQLGGVRKNSQEISSGVWIPHRNTSQNLIIKVRTTGMMVNRIQKKKGSIQY